MALDNPPLGRVFYDPPGGLCLGRVSDSQWGGVNPPRGGLRNSLTISGTKEAGQYRRAPLLISDNIDIITFDY